MASTASAEAHVDNVWAIQKLIVCNPVIQLAQLRLAQNVAFIVCTRVYNTWT